MAGVEKYSLQGWEFAFIRSSAGYRRSDLAQLITTRRTWPRRIQSVDGIKALENRGAVPDKYINCLEELLTPTVFAWWYQELHRRRADRERSGA